MAVAVCVTVIVFGKIIYCISNALGDLRCPFSLDDASAMNTSLTYSGCIFICVEKLSVFYAIMLEFIDNDFVINCVKSL